MVGPHILMYQGVCRCTLVSMGRTNIDIDDELVRRVMRLHGLTTKRQAVDVALRNLVGDPMTTAEALAMEGTGWEGNLNEIRAPDDLG